MKQKEHEVHPVLPFLDASATVQTPILRIGEINKIIRTYSKKNLSPDPVTARITSYLDAEKNRQKDFLDCKVRVVFRPFRNTLYSVSSVKRGIIEVRLHVAFRQASAEVMAQLAGLLFCRSAAQRRKMPRAAYDQFVAALPAQAFALPGAKAELKQSGERGRHLSLCDSFARVNAKYFDGALALPDLQWSQKRMRRTLAHFDFRRDRLTVARGFDSPRTPLFVLDYLVYHELLHKFLEIGKRADGKRSFHHALFRKLERRFEQRAEAEAYLRSF